MQLFGDVRRDLDNPDENEEESQQYGEAPENDCVVGRRDYHFDCDFFEFERPLSLLYILYAIKEIFH